MTLAFREDLESAAAALAVYKNPNIESTLERLNAVLQAGGMGSIEHEHVVAIQAHADGYTIHTEWSARCCAQISKYELPYSIVDADDPIVAAMAWRRETAMANARDRVAEAQLNLERAQRALEMIMNT